MKSKLWVFFIEELAQLKGFDEEVANQVETIYNISREDNSVENDEYYHQLDSLFKNIQVMEPGKFYDIKSRFLSISRSIRIRYESGPGKVSRKSVPTVIHSGGSTYRKDKQ